jgi:PAS domain S-box-containing protein
MANLTAAGWLGIERTRLLKRRFAMFVAADTRSAFHALLARVFETKAPEGGDLRLAIKGKPPFTVQLQACISGDGQECRVVLTDITERKQAHEALRVSEEQYRTLFEKMDEGFCVVEMLYDPDGKAVDYRFVEVNLAFERHTGLQQALGKTIRQMVPNHDAHWFEIYGKVARTGEAIRFENPAKAMQRYYDMFAFRIGGDGSQRVGILFNDITQRKQAEEALRQFSGRLLQMQDEERRRVARELHDTVAQGLAALSLNLGLLRSAATAPNPRSKKLLAESIALADQCAQEVRTSSYLLHPPILDELGLAGAMRDHADGFARRSGLRVDLELPPDLVRLPRETELALFRVLQEALTNIQRHSGSKTASIRVVQTEGEIRLEVQDKGRGMVPKRVPAREASSARNHSMGIFGMRERMRQLGGWLEIQADSHGTSVVATVPRKEETRRP